MNRNKKPLTKEEQRVARLLSKNEREAVTHIASTVYNPSEALYDEENPTSFSPCWEEKGDVLYNPDFDELIDAPKEEPNEKPVEDDSEDAGGECFPTEVLDAVSSYGECQLPESLFEDFGISAPEHIGIGRQKCIIKAGG